VRGKRKKANKSCCSFSPEQIREITHNRTPRPPINTLAGTQEKREEKRGNAMQVRRQGKPQSANAARLPLSPQKVKATQRILTEVGFLLKRKG